MDVEGGQATTTVAVGVDADQMPEVDAIAVVIGGMANDRRFSRTMGSGNAIAKGVPAEVVRRLLVERLVGIVGGMGEKIIVIFKVIDHRVEKNFVAGGQEIEIPVESVAIQSAQSAVFQPDGMVEFASEHGQHHFLVIAHQGDHAGPSRDGDDQIDHGSRLGATVDVIAQKDEGVRRGRRDRSDQPTERSVTAVDITDSNQTIAQIVSLGWWKVSGRIVQRRRAVRRTTSDCGFTRCPCTLKVSFGSATMSRRRAVEVEISFRDPHARPESTTLNESIVLTESTE